MSTRKISLAKSISMLLLLVFVVAGCKKTELYHGLAEGEANEIIVVLYAAGIGAEKEKEIVQNDTFWKVTVDQKDLPEARRLLVERNLPRKEELGLSGVYKEKGLIPTPDEQKARFLLAIKGEIVNSLERIPEVIDADVVINIPTPEEFSSGKDKRPTASAVLKMRPEGDIASQITESKVQQFVANSVEDLNPRDVSVIISYVELPAGAPRPANKLILSDAEKEELSVQLGGESVSIAGIKVSNESAIRLKIYLAIFFVILIIMSAVLVVNIVRTTRMRQELMELSGGVERPLIEGEVAEEGPERLESGEEGSERGEG